MFFAALKSGSVPLRSRRIFPHESFHKDNPEKYTRAWFAWQNTLFGELVIHLINQGKTDLLVHCLD